MVEPAIICAVPVKVTVPLLCVNVPEFEKFPETFTFPLGAVREPVVTKLLNVFTLEPDITVVPLNVTVPPRGVNVPEFSQLPEFVILKLLPLLASRVPAVISIPATVMLAGKVKVPPEPLIFNIELV